MAQLLPCLVIAQVQVTAVVRIRIGGQLPHSLLVVEASSGASSSCGVQQAQCDSTDGDSDRAARNEQPVIGSSLSSEDRLPCMVFRFTGDKSCGREN